MQSLIFDESNDPYIGDVIARRALVPPHATYSNAAVLAANTAKRLAIPAGARYVNFTSNADFFAQFGNNSVNAAIPSGDVTDGTAPIMSPGIRSIPFDATHVSVIAASNSIVTLEYWA